MMHPFTFKQFPKIIFGAGVRGQIPINAAQYGSNTLIITGGNSFIQSIHFGEFSALLKEFKINTTLAQVSGEPSPQDVDLIVAENRNRQINSVIAIGGGSVLDAGKAVSAMLTEDGPVMDYLEGVGISKPSGTKLPFIAVPTTSGTGSETTANAVLSVVGPNGFKKSLRHDNYIPDIAIIDPELTLSCPPSLTATCGMDCFTQLVEAYLSTNSSPLTDAFALQGIEAISRSLQLSCNHGDNVKFRADLSYAAMLSGIVLANAGLGTVHGFASAIGGVVAAPHGMVCGTLMEPSNRMTLQQLRQNDTDNPALAKYCQLGKIFSNEQHKSDSWYQDHFIATLAELSESLSIPDFTEYALSDESIERIITNTGNKYNPVEFDQAELKNMLKSRC